MEERVIAMTTTLNLYQAKTQLSKLVERAAAGEEIVTEGGHPDFGACRRNARPVLYSYGAVQAWAAAVARAGSLDPEAVITSLRSQQECPVDRRARPRERCWRGLPRSASGWSPMPRS
jgi:hypothetical protein